MRRVWVWLHLVIGWLPIWALFTALIAMTHNAPVADAAAISLRMMIAAAFLGVLVHRLSARWPWPHPMRVRFAAQHAIAAIFYALSWIALNSLIESAIHTVRIGRPELSIVLGPGFVPFFTAGIWIYAMVAGVAYAGRAAERTARAEALAARTQLANLRAQLHPHFLFNALHTVIHLIPIDPRGAARAAEHLAAALRVAIEEKRDLVPLREEWAFVQRYLAIECIRFGDRLRVRAEIDADADATVPSFALQTLIENAVRHGAAPRVETTTLSVSGQLVGDVLTLTVADDGAGASDAQVERSTGTGLRRLRERLAWLYGPRAELVVAGIAGERFQAILRLPQSHAASQLEHDDDD